MAASLLDEIAALEAETSDVEEKLEDTLRKQRAKDQSRIAWLIIWAFVVALGIVFALVLVHVIPPPEPGAPGGDAWKSSAEFLLSAISSVLLPVVTLVLGYYFGKEKS